MPALLENLVARELKGRLGLDAVPEVALRGDPAGMLAGEFGGGRVSLPAAELAGVRAEEVEVELSPFDVDVLGSVTGGGVRFEQPPSGMLRVELSEDEVGRIAASQVTDFPIMGVNLEEGRAVARTGANVFGRILPVSVEGGVGAQDNALVFEPRGVEAAGITVPGDLAQGLLRATSFVHPVEGLPPGVQITGARAESDRLVLTGRVGGLL